MSGLRQLKAQGVDLNTTLELTDKRSVSAFNTFLDGADAALALRDSLEDVNGVLKNTAEERVNTVEGSVKLLQSAWEGLILSFKDSTGPIKEVIDWLTKLIEVTSDLVSSGSKQSFYKDFSEDFARKLEDFHGNEEVMKSYIKEARKIYEKGLSQAQATYDNQSGFSRWWHYSGDKLNIARNALEGFDLAAAQYQNASGGGAASSSSPSGSTPPSNPPSLQNPQKNKSLWSLSNDEAFLTAKAELTRRYNEKEISSQEEYDERIYQLEVATLTARLAAHKDKGAERAKIENELQEKTKKHSEDALKKRQEYEKKAAELAKEGTAIINEAETDKTKAAMDGEEVRYQAELKKFKETQVLYENQAAVLEAIEKKHQNNLMKIRMDAEAKEMAKLKTAHDLNRLEIKNEYEQKMSALPVGPSKEKSSMQRSMNADLVSSDLAYLENLKTELKKITDSGEFDGAVIPEEELNKYKLQLQQTIEKITELKNKQNEDTAGVFAGTGKGSLFGVSQEQWDQFFANLSDGRLKAEDLASALTGMGGLAQEGFQLASKAIELTNAKENKAFNEYKKNNEKKKKDLKSRYDAGLVSQEQYNAKVEEMEAEEEAKREEMEIKQAKRTKALNLVQSIINTALSVTKTLAQWGWPAGAAPAAIVAAFGAAQTALIAAQPIGAEEGGFVNTRRAQDGKAFKARLSPDKRGFVSSPTVLVGENGGEYVIPADGLSNPTLLPFVATMEEARKAGTLKSLNFEAVYPVGAAIGRESGGFTGTSTSPVTGIDSGAGAVVSARSATDERLLEAIELLNKRLSVPIKADVSMLGKNGIIEQTEKYNRAKRRGTYGR